MERLNNALVNYGAQFVANIVDAEVRFTKFLRRKGISRFYAW